MLGIGAQVKEGDEVGKAVPMIGGRRAVAGWTVACIDRLPAVRSSSTRALAEGPSRHWACSLAACGIVVFRVGSVGVGDARSWALLGSPGRRHPRRSHRLRRAREHSGRPASRFVRCALHCEAASALGSLTWMRFLPSALVTRGCNLGVVNVYTSPVSDTTSSSTWVPVRTDSS
jgi:hypothetical protein